MFLFYSLESLHFFTRLFCQRRMLENFVKPFGFLEMFLGWLVRLEACCSDEDPVVVE